MLIEDDPPASVAIDIYWAKQYLPIMRQELRNPANLGGIIPTRQPDLVFLSVLAIVMMGMCLWQ